MAKCANHLSIDTLRLDPNVLNTALYVDDGLLAVIFARVGRRGTFYWWLEDHRLREVSEQLLNLFHLLDD